VTFIMFLEPEIRQCCCQPGVSFIWRPRTLSQTRERPPDSLDDCPPFCLRLQRHTTRHDHCLDSIHKGKRGIFCKALIAQSKRKETQ
jgi:hypothetical protein